nr:hypothetical protein [Tanacetum cinerariifolium]
GRWKSRWGWCWLGGGNVVMMWWREGGDDVGGGCDNGDGWRWAAGVVRVTSVVDGVVGSEVGL